MMAILTADQVRQKLRQKACDMGSQKAIADEVGVSNTFVSDILAGKRAPSGKILAFLGLSRVVRYKEIT